MKLIYINLDIDGDRNERMVSLLKEDNLLGIAERFSGIQAGVAIKGLSLSETGCLHSHVAVLNSLDGCDAVAIMEDDVCFSSDFSERIPMITSLLDKSDVDILFLGQTVLFKDYGTHSVLIKMIEKFKSTKKYVLLDAEKFYRFGTFAYVVNKHATSKVKNLLDKIDIENMPGSIDVILGEWLRTGRLKGAVVFPYLVGVNSELPTTMKDRKNYFEHSLHAKLINIYLMGSEVNGLRDWLDVLCDSPNQEALVVCRTLYSRLTR